jgi:hypothetical protein
LKLSQLWGFSRVKELAVRFIEQNKTLDPVERIAIYQEHRVDRVLLIPSYIDLIERPEPLDLEEASDLGLETSLAIMVAREFSRGVESSRGRTSAPLSAGRELIAEFVRRTFFPLPVNSPLRSGTNHTGGLPMYSIDTAVSRTPGKYSILYLQK